MDYYKLDTHQFNTIQDPLAIECVSLTCLKDILAPAVLKFDGESATRLPRGHSVARVLYPPNVM